MSDESRILDPTLLNIVMSYPTPHVGVYLRYLLALEKSEAFQVRGSREEFCALHPESREHLSRVLQESDVLTPELAEQLNEYMGLERDNDLLIRLQNGWLEDQQVVRPS